MGEGNRTVLPLPLIGHFDTREVKWVTIETTEVPVTALEHLREQIAQMGELAADTQGELHYDGGVTRFTVFGRTTVDLTVDIEADANPVLFHQLIERLQSSYDEIRVHGPSWGLAEHFRDRGFYPDARVQPVFDNFRGEGPAVVEVPTDITHDPNTRVPALVWFKPRPAFLAS